jgi:hypothetical protein
MIRFMFFYLHTMFGSLADPQVRPYLVAAANLIALGTIFYTLVEGWHVLDAAYFCVITLATVGFGDFTPVTRLGKLFTMFYIVAGLGVLSAFIGAMTRVSVERAQQRRQGEKQTQQASHRQRKRILQRHEHHDNLSALETDPLLRNNPVDAETEQP